MDNLTGLEQVAGQGSMLAKKHGSYFQQVTMANVPEDYAERLTELFAGRFSRLRLLAYWIEAWT